MKTLFSILSFVCILACKAQTLIVNRDASISNKPQGTYFKDLNNEFEKFEGTWLYTNGNISFTITLQKKEMVYSDTFSYYFDDLYGEYKYIENGVELINTLPTLTSNPNDIANRNIGGGYFIPNNMFVACDDCAPNERRVKLYISDPERDYLSVSLVLRYLVDETSPEKMTATIFAEHGGLIPTEDSPTSLRVPYGEYLMVKQ